MVFGARALARVGRGRGVHGHAALPRRRSPANVYAGFRAAYRTWLEVLGSDGALTVPNPFRPGPLETLELERDGAIERSRSPGSPLIFVREVEDFEAARARRRAAGRQPGREPPHRGHARGALRLGARLEEPCQGIEACSARASLMYPQ